MYISQEIATRIKEQIKKQNLSVRDFLSSCGLNINTISELSKGKQISYLNFAKIADNLECSVDYLLGRSTAQHETSEKEKRVISAYRDNPDIQPAVDRLLKIEEPALHLLPQDSPAQTTARMSAGDDVNISTTVNSSIDERLALAEELKQDQKAEKNGKNKRNKK